MAKHMGLQDLMRLVSVANFKNMNKKEPYLEFADLENLSKGIIILDGGPWGEIGDALKQNDKKGKIYDKYKNYF